MLTITKTMENGALTLVLKGELNTLTAPELGKAVEEHIDSASSITFDMEALEYISSAGLRILLTTQQTMDEKGLPTVMVKNSGEVVRETFGITGFDNILHIL